MNEFWKCFRHYVWCVLCVWGYLGERTRRCNQKKNIYINYCVFWKGFVIWIWVKFFYSANHFQCRERTAKYWVTHESRIEIILNWICHVVCLNAFFIGFDSRTAAMYRCIKIINRLCTLVYPIKLSYMCCHLNECGGIFFPFFLLLVSLWTRISMVFFIFFIMKKIDEIRSLTHKDTIFEIKAPQTMAQQFIPHLQFERMKFRKFGILLSSHTAYIQTVAFELGEFYSLENDEEMVFFFARVHIHNSHTHTLS